jgi:hypothetical protein
MKSNGLNKKSSDSYWIPIIPKKHVSGAKEDGKWVVFIRRNFNGIPKADYVKLIEKLQSIVETNDLIGAIARRKNLDIINFFTSADRDEIWRVKQIIMQELRVKESDLIWKADFETDYDWVRGKGKLWFLYQLLFHLDKKDNSLRQGSVIKAEAIQKKGIDPLLSRFHKTMLEENTMNRRSMVVTPAFPSIEYEIDPALVFVLMPFTEKWSDDVYLMIRQASENLPLRIQRADDIFAPGNIVNDIWKMINRAGLIIADISVHNANIFYELGLSHTIGKKVVLIRQSHGEKAPFDLALWRYFEYGLMPREAEEFKKALRKVLENYCEEYSKSKDKNSG